MTGIVINGIKYMYIVNDNDFKKKSLYDNVYFTLRDIFANADSFDTIMESNCYNSILTGNVSFEDRTDKFQYANVLDKKDYTGKLLNWLKNFNVNWFNFYEPEEYEETDMTKYMKLDEWWVQFEDLRHLIKDQYEKCCMQEEDVVWLFP